MRNNPDNLLTLEEMAVCKQIIMDAISPCILISMKPEDLISSLTHLFYDFDWTMIHTGRLLNEVSSKVFYDATLRNFVLNLMDRVAIQLSVKELSMRKLSTTMVFGYSANRELAEENPSSLIPQKIKETLQIDKEEFEEILTCNFWLVCLMVINVNIDEFISRYPVQGAA